MGWNDIINNSKYDNNHKNCENLETVDISLNSQANTKRMVDRVQKKLLIKLEKNNLSAYARQYMNKNDPLYEWSKSIKPIDGFEDFMIHGQPNFVEYETTNGQWIKLTPEDYAESLKSDKEYHGGNIRLLACNSGMLDDGFAQQLSNIMGVKVMAPTQTLWVNNNGEMFIADSEVLADLWHNGENVHQTGVWKVFVPQKEGK